jgi:hypothetical protein
MCVQLCTSLLIKWPSVSRGVAVGWCTALQAGMWSLHCRRSHCTFSPNAASRTVALSSNQPLTKQLPGIFNGGKRGPSVGLSSVLKSGNLHIPNPQGLYRTALPLHLLSAVCRSTQFVTSTNNVVSQRGWRSASCIVDVDWLMVWVQLVVRARDEHYRDAHVYRPFIAWNQMNPW